MVRWLNGRVGSYGGCERFASTSMSLLNLVCVNPNLIAHMTCRWITTHIWVWLCCLSPFLRLLRRSTHLCTISGLSLGPGFQVEWSWESISIIENSIPLSSSTYAAALFISFGIIRVDKIISQILIYLPSIAAAYNVDDLGCFVAWMSSNLAFPVLSNGWFVRGFGLVVTLHNYTASEALCSSGSRGTSHTLFLINSQGWRCAIKIGWCWFILSYCFLKGGYWGSGPNMLSRVTLGSEQHILQIY